MWCGVRALLPIYLARSTLFRLCGQGKKWKNATENVLSIKTANTKIPVSRRMRTCDGMFNCLLFVLWWRVCLKNKLNFRFFFLLCVEKGGATSSTTKIFNFTAKTSLYTYLQGEMKYVNKDICCQFGDDVDVEINLWKNLTSIHEIAVPRCHVASIYYRDGTHWDVWNEWWFVGGLKVLGACCPSPAAGYVYSHFNCGDDE